MNFIFVQKKVEAKKIKTALISVFDKQGLEPIAKQLHQNGVKIISTGGTKDFIEKLQIPVVSVEQITTFRSILGGRVKTLHPLIFGGILSRRSEQQDIEEMIKFNIGAIDLVIVDLYPFEKTVASTTDNSQIIEKIDIGGISLIRAAAKNYQDVVVIPSKEYYNVLENIIQNQVQSTLEQRRELAKAAFNVSSHYDTAIYKYFSDNPFEALKISVNQSMELRYGENPHQQGRFFGNFNDIFEQLFGKQISYNNLLDIDSAVNLIADFDEPTIAIIKHNNACGLASRDNMLAAWTDALAGDPLSAFGGIIVANRPIDNQTAEEINKIFYEVVIAPDFSPQALEILMSKKNRIILKQKHKINNPIQVRSALNGFLVQEKDQKIVTHSDFQLKSTRKPSKQEIEDLIFANKIVKHSKSNTIVLTKNKQLIGSGVGMTSRVDALKFAITKAQTFGFETKGAVMASDAFFPFADSVEIAYNQGIEAVIEPGGSIKDQDTIDFCNKNNMLLIFTGFRHFKH